MQTTFGAHGELVVGIRIDTSQAQRDLTGLVTQYEILERTIAATAGTFARFTGDENLKQGAITISRTIALINQLQLASSLLMATNPWLWPLGAIGLIGFGMNLIDLGGSFYT